MLTTAQVVVDTTVHPVSGSLMTPDSTSTIPDSLVLYSGNDSVSKKPVVTKSWIFDPGNSVQLQILINHPFFNFGVEAVSYRTGQKRFEGKEILFYVIIGLVLAFSLLKTTFAKYFIDLLRVFFRTSLKQRQIKEQLLQTPLPSLLFNGFFIASTGLYINFLLHYYELIPSGGYWLMYLYSCTGLAFVYLVKYIGLKVCGWLFNLKHAADAYIFIVFLINKVLGIALLPFLILIAFTGDTLHEISLNLSFCCVAVLFLYRFILGYSAIHNDVRFNLFHFFLYLCAFEIAPLLLIYKLLLFFL